jgi:hypothetical protein
MQSFGGTVMEKNIGKRDKTIRIIAALVLAVLAVSGTISGVLGVILIIIAAILFITAFVGSCPLYTLLKTSTKEKEEPGDKE